MNIIHRNISLDNIMFCNKQAKPVLIQFGVDKEQINKHSYVNYKHKQLSNLLVGQFGYSPPEQLCMGYSSPCSDLYSLGVCAIVLLTGKTPSMLINNLLEWEWESYTNINKYLTMILKKILSEKPNERYQSAKEILTDIQALNLGQN